jgi:hypothetical protein
MQSPKDDSAANVALTVSIGSWHRGDPPHGVAGVDVPLVRGGLPG